MRNIIIILMLAIAVGAAVMLKSKKQEGLKPASEREVSTIAETVEGDSAKTDPVVEPVIESVAEPVKLPRMVDLGADKCIPCKMMAPILDELEIEMKGKLDVVFIDVWKNADEGSKYGIKLIPTQIFFAADGKELFRHEGFFSRDDILAKWKELGYEF